MDLRNMSCWFIFILYTSCWIVFADELGYKYVTIDDKLKVCLVETARSSKKILLLCPKMLTSAVECVIETDRFGCIRRLMNDDADFTILEPEELVAIRNYDIYNFLITNELRLFQNAMRFEVVAIGHKNLHHAYDVKGKRLCHPGFETVGDWTKSFSTYFENLIARKQCEPNMSLLENRIQVLSNLFEMACIAGPWSSDTTIDYYLKTKYRNLCAACENPASCYNTDKYYGRQGAVLCLVDGVGDVGWVRLDDARIHFKVENVDTQDYRFLCSDGTTKPLNFDEPCVWISKPWPAIVARAFAAKTVARIMNLNNMTAWGTNLLELLEDYYVTSVNVEELQPPFDHLQQFPNFLSANIRTECSRDVKWCVKSLLEMRKCEWMKMAASAYGIQPNILCYQYADTGNKSCLESVQSGQTHISVILPEELLEARKKNLEPIAHMMTNTRQGLSRVAAIVRLSSSFKTLRDLKGFKAVFTGYRSVGWNAFTSVMRNESQENWDCSDTQAISNFFANSCVLGLENKDKNVLPSNLHSLCVKDGEASDDATAFHYLTSGIVDVAFVDLNVVENITKPGDFLHQKVDLKNLNSKPKYRVLSQTLAEAIKGTPYVLAWTALGSIVMQKNVTEVRHRDIYSMLVEMDKLFGKHFNGETPAFSLYAPYEGNLGVIFPDGTRYIELHGHQTVQGRNYDEVVEDIINQSACNAAHAWLTHFPLVLCIVVVFLYRSLDC
ncbi:transferrin isoform X2 [Linepithema humile]|uniref:transferrin isoform X2 n=1 Tax=Linepithema humile TaxID=83485 RepID=UPI00351E6417